MFDFIKDNAVKLALGTTLVIAGAGVIYWTVASNSEDETPVTPIEPEQE
jgi:hypothetical protein